MNNCRPIGFFDSGVGGLTVLQEVARLLPHEQFVYFGDTARFPYGNKSNETILRFARENAQFLLSHQIKLLVIPCYTACSHAYDALQKTLPIPVIGVMESGAELLAAATKTESVAILGTSSTIASGVLQTKVRTLNPQLQIHSIACPLFPFFAEEGLQNHPMLHKIARHYLAPLQTTNVDCVLLACTHFPLLSETIAAILGPHIQLISPAAACAAEILATLQHHQLLNTSKIAPNHRFFVSLHPKKFERLVSRFLKIPVRKIELAKNKAL